MSLLYEAVHDVDADTCCKLTMTVEVIRHSQTLMSDVLLIILLLLMFHTLFAVGNLASKNEQVKCVVSPITRQTDKSSLSRCTAYHKSNI